MGSLFAYWAAEAVTSVKRAAVVWGTIAAAALLATFSAGYALHAAYLLLAFRVGSTVASLVVAGGLLVLALSAAVIAVLISRRSRAPGLAERFSPYSPAASRPPYPFRRLGGLAAAAAGAASAAAVIFKFEGVRRFTRGRPST